MSKISNPVNELNFGFSQLQKKKFFESNVNCMYHLICFTCCELKLFVSLVEKVLNENELCLVSPKSVAICSVLGDDDSALSTPFWPLDGRGDLNRDLACLLASLEAGS